MDQAKLCHAAGTISLGLMRSNKNEGKYFLIIAAVEHVVFSEIFLHNTYKCSYSNIELAFALIDCGFMLRTS